MAEHHSYILTPAEVQIEELKLKRQAETEIIQRQSSLEACLATYITSARMQQN